MSRKRYRVAEFFAGIGLVRLALENEGFSVVFANDIEPSKHALYAANFDDRDFVLGDVRKVRGSDIPDIELATASFPCTDLSLAGLRAGIEGASSGMFWEFARVIGEMGERRPATLLLENVIGFASSNDGNDMRGVIRKINELGYVCDIITMDAKWFVPQSRPRLFIVCSRHSEDSARFSLVSQLRPEWVHRFIEASKDLKFRTFRLPTPPRSSKTLAGAVERMPETDERWWDKDRVSAFVASLSPVQSDRLRAMREGEKASWATAYRRTRKGVAVWEIRADGLSGCLRTARGGSSKQAVVEAGGGDVRVRWMTSREYARLQGAPEFKIDGVRESSVLFGFGDGVCVPVIAWIVKHYLRPILDGATLEHASSFTARRAP